MIAARDWLEHHSGRVAQECALRLATSSHAIVPSDQDLQALVEDQMKSDILLFAFHTRRVLEGRNDKNASISTDPLWPVSSAEAPKESLWDVLGKIIHGKEINVCWEAPDIKPNPYKGRSARFAGAINVTSDVGSTKIPVGAIVATFVGSILNRSDQV